MLMKKKLKIIPKFKSEREEARFWATHDSIEYVDYSKAKRVLFPKFKPLPGSRRQSLLRDTDKYSA